ncbi:MAG: ATP-binding protein [Gammaproteobacteria bacterium]|nr:MAG: ATP-binding protein [Gammaproteobacteria bacterium]
MNKKDNSINEIFSRTEALIDRVENFFPKQDLSIDSDIIAWRWKRQNSSTELKPVRHVHAIRLMDLQAIDRQRDLLNQNTRQFVAGKPANNALLWGSRGTGKSSLIKALLNEYADQGLRIIEIDKHDLIDLPEIIDLVWDRDERFILYSDDLSFEASDPGYKSLKAALDGSVSALPNNVLIYATSNRRHLLPEYMQENNQSRMIEDEIHHGEAVEEKISLSERFGLWISFYPFNQDKYLEIADHWLDQLGCETTDNEDIRELALRWALERGSRSGRVAHQFARDLAGKESLAKE